MTLQHIDYAVSSDEVASYWRNGFLHLRNILSAAEVHSLSEAMASAVSTLGESPNAYDLTLAADQVWGAAALIDSQGSTQHDLSALAMAVRKSNKPRLLDPPKAACHRGSFLLDTSVWRRTPALADFAQNSKIPRIAATLLSAPSLRFYDDQLFIKQPGAIDRAAFHQDLSYFHLDSDMGCVFWIPLTKVRQGGGRMGYVPGSHRWNQVYNPNIFASALAFPGSMGTDMPDIDADPEKYGVKYLEADPGDVIVHHFTTIHGSEGNSSDVARSAFSLRYCDGDARYMTRQGAPKQPLHRGGMGDGDALDDTVHPVVINIR